MKTNKQLSVKQIICANIIAAEEVAGNVCQGLAVKLAKAFVFSKRGLNMDELCYISQQCEIALENIHELSLTADKDIEFNNICKTYYNI